jgi:hypothetical protein
VHELAARLAARGAPAPASALLAAVPDAIRTVRAATHSGASVGTSEPAAATVIRTS